MQEDKASDLRVVVQQPKNLESNGTTGLKIKEEMLPPPPRRFV
jgi:hypothetical protein